MYYLFPFLLVEHSLFVHWYHSTLQQHKNY